MRIPQEYEQFEDVATVTELRGLVDIDRRLKALASNKWVQEHEQLATERKRLLSDLEERQLAALDEA